MYMLSTKEDVYYNITISSKLGGNGPRVLVVAGFLGQRVMIDDRIFAINVADPIEQQHHGNTQQSSVLLQISFSSRLVPKMSSCLLSIHPHKDLLRLSLREG